MTIAQTYAGCDVCKAHLDLCLSDGERIVLQRRFANDPRGVEALLKTLAGHEDVFQI